MPEPVDVRALMWAVMEDIYDRLGGLDALPDETIDWLDANVEQPVLRLICEARGHEIVNDQCMKPEHRYCVMCGVLFPDAELTT